jgi:hypothetical protein
MIKSPKCISEGIGVTGIVATNSTLYSEGPPSFDSATSTLNYKVAAPHYEKDGKTEFKGRYDLILRSDIAKCLYGLDDSPVTSEVAVVDESGAPKTATTSMTQSDGWFKFSAAGYTHSAPTVKTKLLQTKTPRYRSKATDEKGKDNLSNFYCEDSCTCHSQRRKSCHNNFGEVQENMFTLTCEHREGTEER